MIQARRQGITLFTAVAAIVMVMVTIQLWLLGSSMDALELGDARTGTWAAVGSAVLFAGNVGLLLYVRAFDRRIRGLRGAQ